MDLPVVVAGLMAQNVRLALEGDLVFAAWLDDTQPQGIDFILLKGDAVLDRRVELDQLSMSAIRVGDQAEALELQKLARERGNGGF